MDSFAALAERDRQRKLNFIHVINRKIKICNICLGNVNTPTSSRNSSHLSTPVSLNTRLRNNSTSSTTSAGGMSDVRRTPPSDEILSMLLGKMNKLDKLDGIEAKISNFLTSLTNMTDKMGDFTEKLRILETIPVLLHRVDAAEVDINKLKSDCNYLRQIVDSKLSSTDPEKGVTITSWRVQHLEESNASLSS